MFAIITVALMCVSLMVPAMAAQEFMPSVTNKPAPEVMVARILDKDGSVIEEVGNECLIITPVSEANTSTEIPAASREVLLNVYGKLLDGSMTIPYEKHNDNLDPSKMVIRDLFDATFVCTECPELLEPEGVVLEIVFDLNVAPGVNVYAMTYKNDQWDPIVSCVNNGDGTVTATFEKLCPVEFSINTDTTPPSGTGDVNPFSVWGVIAIVSLAAIVILTVVYVVGSKKRA
jgi:hypothetical protein